MLVDKVGRAGRHMLLGLRTHWTHRGLIPVAPMRLYTGRLDTAKSLARTRGGGA